MTSAPCRECKTFDTFLYQYCINDTEQNNKQDEVSKAPSVLELLTEPIITIENLTPYVEWTRISYNSKACWAILLIGNWWWSLIEQHCASRRISLLRLQSHSCNSLLAGWRSLSLIGPCLGILASYWRRQRDVTVTKDPCSVSTRVSCSAH